MADALIEVVGPETLPVLVKLYNQIFRPSREIASFNRRYLGRHNVLQLLARVQSEAVGFFYRFRIKTICFLHMVLRSIA